MTSLLNTKTMHPRDQITLVMKRIYDRVLTTTSGGNLSIRDDDGNVWITPAGVDKGLLKPSDIICVKKMEQLSAIIIRHQNTLFTWLFITGAPI
ncbi:class II aldolase/adducin family protein [Niabella hibiscisoli]|nr:class II aldolase/adducin family protein [Niabella hibiscisoli]MCH5719014.1 class II aldolase/adducin family protein [Niabella hibiscisoli]